MDKYAYRRRIKYCGNKLLAFLLAAAMLIPLFATLPAISPAYAEAAELSQTDPAAVTDLLATMSEWLPPGVNTDIGTTLRYVNTAKDEYKAGETITLKLAMVNALFSPEPGVSYRVVVTVDDPDARLEYVGYNDVSYVRSVTPLYEGPGGALSEIIVEVDSSQLAPGTVVEASVNLRFSNGTTPDEYPAVFTGQMQRSNDAGLTWNYWNNPEGGYDNKTVTNIAALNWNASLGKATSLTIPDALFEDSIIRLQDSISDAQTFTFRATNNKPATGWLYTDELTLKAYIYVPSYVYPPSITPGAETLGVTGPTGSSAEYKDANGIVYYNAYNDPGDKDPASFFTQADFTYPLGTPDDFNFVGTFDANFGLNGNAFYINTTHASKPITYYVYEFDWVFINANPTAGDILSGITNIDRSVTLGDAWFYANPDSMIYKSSDTDLLNGQGAYFMSRVGTSAVPVGPDNNEYPNVNKPVNSNSTSLTYGYVRYTTKRSGSVHSNERETAMNFNKSVTKPPVTSGAPPVEYPYDDTASMPEFWLYGINNLCDDKAGFKSQPLSELFIIDAFSAGNSEQDVFDKLALSSIYTGTYTIGASTGSDSASTAERAANMMRYKDMYMTVSFTYSADPHDAGALWTPIDFFDAAASGWSAAIQGWHSNNPLWDGFSYPLFKPGSYGTSPSYTPSGVYSANTGATISFVDVVPAVKAANTVYVVLTEEQRYDITGVKIQYFNPTDGDKGGIPPSFRQESDDKGPRLTYKNVGDGSAQRPYPNGTVVNEATLYYNREFTGDAPKVGTREDITDTAGVIYQSPDYMTVSGNKSFTTVSEDPLTGELVVDAATQDIQPDGILEYSLTVTNTTAAATSHVFTLNQLLLHDQPDPKLTVLPDNAGPFEFEYTVYASNGSVLNKGMVEASWETSPPFGYPDGADTGRPILVIHLEKLDDSIGFPRGSTVEVNYRMRAPSAGVLTDVYHWDPDTNPTIELQNKYWWALWYGSTGPGKTGGSWHWQQRGGGGSITISVVPGGMPTVSIEKEITNSPPEGRTYWEAGDLVEFTITARHISGVFPDGLRDPYVTIGDIISSSFNYNQTRATSPTSSISRIARDAEVWHKAADGTLTKLGRINRESAAISGESWAESPLIGPDGLKADKQSRGPGENYYPNAGAWLSTTATTGPGVAEALRAHMTGKQGYYFLGQTSARTTLSTNSMAFLLDRERYFQVGDEIIIKYLVSANTTLANSTDIDNTAFLAFETESDSTGSVIMGYNSNVCEGYSPPKTGAPALRYTLRSLGNNNATVDLRFYNSALIVYDKAQIRMYQPSIKVDLTKEVVSSIYDEANGKYYFRYLVTIANEPSTVSARTYPFRDPTAAYPASQANVDEVKWNWSLRDILPPGQTIVAGSVPGRSEITSYWVWNTSSSTTYPLRPSSTSAANLANYATLATVVDPVSGVDCEIVAFRLCGSNATGSLSNSATATTGKLYLYYWTVMDEDAWGGAGEVSKENYVALLPDEANISAGGGGLGMLTNDANHDPGFTAFDSASTNWADRNYIANSALVRIDNDLAALDIIKFNQASVTISGNNLGMTASDYNPVYEPGGFPIFRIAVRNNGRTPAVLKNGFQIVDQLPAMLGFDDTWAPMLTTYNASGGYVPGSTTPFVYIPDDEYIWDSANNRLVFNLSKDTLELLYKVNNPTGVANWYKDGTLSYNANAYASGVAVVFRARIGTEASGTFVNNAYVFPEPSQGIDPGGIVTGSYVPKETFGDVSKSDTEFYDRQGVMSGVPLTVVGVYSLSSWKEVRNLETTETATGRYGFEEFVEASGGDTLRYTVNVSSDSSRFTFDDIVVIDQVPYLGDTGVIDTRDRASRFDMLFPSNLNLDVRMNNMDVTGLATVEYSSKTAIELTADDWAGASAPGWYATPQPDTKLIRVVLPKHIDGSPGDPGPPPTPTVQPVAGLALLPNGVSPYVDNSLKISFDMVVPNDAPETYFVWNSFGYELLPRSNADAAKEGFNFGYGARLKAEPIRVGARIKSVDISFHKLFSDTFGLGAPFDDVSFFLEEVRQVGGEWERMENGHSYVFGGVNVSGRTFDLDSAGVGEGTIAKGDYVITEPQLAGYYLKDIVTNDLSFQLIPLDTLDGHDAAGVYLLKLSDRNDTKLFITAENDVRTFDFDIYKVDENGNPLHSAAFAVYYDESCDPASIMPNNSMALSAAGTGKVAFNGLKPETYYYLKEISPPARYKPNTTLYRFKLDPDGAGVLEQRVGAGWASVAENKIANEPYALTYVLHKIGDLPKDANGLQFAVFDAHTDSTQNDKLGSYESDANGDVVIGGLWVDSVTGVGVFYIQEEYAPSPYERDPVLYKLTITLVDGVPQFRLVKDGDDTVEYDSIVNRSVRYDFEFLKMAERSNAGAAPGIYPHAGVGFTLYYDSDCLNPVKDAGGLPEPPKTSAAGTGKVIFTDIQPGTYYMKETTAPASGYEEGVVYEVVISDSGDVSIALESGTAREPAKNSDGEWELVNLYKRFDFSFEKRLNKDSNVLITATNTSLTATYGEVEYAIFYDAGGFNPVLDALSVPQTALSANDSSVTFTGLPPGTYYIMETAIHGHYSSTHNISSEVIKVVIDGNGAADVQSGLRTLTGSTTAYAINPLKYGYCEFQKVDSVTGKGLPGAKFEVYRGGAITHEDSTTHIGDLLTVTTNFNGMAYVVDEEDLFGLGASGGVLTDMYYWLKESVAPVGYEPGDVWYRLERTNNPAYQPNPGLPNYDRWAYIYILQNEFGVDLDYITNTRIALPVTLEKKDADNGALIAGAAEFTLYTHASCAPGFEFSSKTTVGGSVTFDGLLYGETYYLKETMAPYGYAANMTVYSLTVSGTVGDPKFILVPLTGPADPDDMDEGVIRNHKLNYDFPIFKQGEGSAANGLAGAAFRLHGGVVDMTSQLTNSSGVVWFRHVPVGTYTLEETVTPGGYTPSGPWTVSVDESGNVTISLNGGGLIGDYIHGVSGEHTLTLLNERLHYGVSFKKTDGSGAALDGAEFGLYSNLTCTNLLQTAVSGHGGVAGITAFFGLIPDTYYIREILPPSTYAISDNIYKVIINAGGAYTIELVTTHNATDGEPLSEIKNEKIAAMLSFRKTDREMTRMTGSPAGIAGVEFNLSIGGVIVLGPFVSDADGWVRLTGLEAGMVYVLEETIPGGYSLSGAYTVEVSSVGEAVLKHNGISTITVENIRLTATVTFNKKSSGSLNLNGAKFTLYDDAAATVRTARAPEWLAESVDGVVTFHNVPWGVYYMKETTAPDGYEPIDTIWEIVIGMDLKVAIFDGVTEISTIYNTRLTTQRIYNYSYIANTPDGGESPYGGGDLPEDEEHRQDEELPEGDGLLTDEEPELEDATPRSVESGEASVTSEESADQMSGDDDLNTRPDPMYDGDELVWDEDGWIELGADGSPLGKWKWDEDLLEWIFEPITPLSADVVFEMPKTGSYASMILPIAALGLNLIAFGIILNSKRRFRRKT